MMSMARTLKLLVLVAVCIHGVALGDYDVRVDLKNVSGEAKTDWPVILRVYTMLGRNLDPTTIRRDGFHVYDPSGAEVPHGIEQLPPYDLPGNDELIFVIPRIKPGETLTYRFTNTARKSDKRVAIDVVNSRHNLIQDGGFEAAARPAHFSAPARPDGKVAHSGKSSLALTADNETVSTKYAKTVKLHKGSWYYFGAWSRTDNVSRYGLHAGSAAHFRFTGTDPKTKKTVGAFVGRTEPQCSTRNWLKVAFTSGVDDWVMDRCSDWGMDYWTARARTTEAVLEFVLEQRRHFYMAQGKTRGRWWLDDVVLMAQPEVTVRFDLTVKPLMKDGMFVFTRPSAMHLGRIDQMKRGRKEWCAFPYAHERLTGLDKSALKGQRVSYCVGLYHTREVKDVTCRLVGMALAGRGRAAGKIPVELIEYCPGFLGPDKRPYMDVLNSDAGVRPVTLTGPEGVRYFFLTFRVPVSARPGRYAGTVELACGQKVLRRVPVTLRVQDLVQPVPKDVFVGIIYQGRNPRFDDEGMTVYSRSGFNSITRFGSFFDYAKDEKGNWQVDLEKLHKKMMWMKGYGMEAVCVFSDFDLGPKWNGGSLLKRTRPRDFDKAGAWGNRLKTAQQAWKAQVERIESARRKHPEWPVFIYMTWDEPSLGGGRNGRPDPAMGWVNQVAPDALTTLDVQFAPLPVCLKWYTMPAFDDPANWAGPEIYRWVRRQGKQFGFCGAAATGEGARSQPGLLMAATGAKFFHAWHLGLQQVAYDKGTKRLLRGPAMINWADGMSDLKAYTLLKEAIRQAERDPRKARAVKSARDYLKKFFTRFNGDYHNSWPLRPYLGSAASWGWEGFYDDWQTRMLRHAAAIKGVQWIE